MSYLLLVLVVAGFVGFITTLLISLIRELWR